MLDAKLCLQKVSKNVKTVTFKIFETRWREFFTKIFWQTFAALVYFSSHFACRIHPENVIGHHCD